MHISLRMTLSTLFGCSVRIWSVYTVTAIRYAYISPIDLIQGGNAGGKRWQKTCSEHVLVASNQYLWKICTYVSRFINVWRRGCSSITALWLQLTIKLVALYWLWSYMWIVLAKLGALYQGTHAWKTRFAALTSPQRLPANACGHIHQPTWLFISFQSPCNSRSKKGLRHNTIRCSGYSLSKIWTWISENAPSSHRLLSMFRRSSFPCVAVAADITFYLEFRFALLISLLFVPSTMLHTARSALDGSSASQDPLANKTWLQEPGIADWRPWKVG